MFNLGLLDMISCPLITMLFLAAVIVIVSEA